MRDLIELRAGAIDPSAEYKLFEAGLIRSGAIASFSGLVRGEDRGGRVTRLRLEHYPGMTEREIERIEQQARERWKLEDVRIVHRVGDAGPGDVLVFVAAASDHRRDAFEAVDYIMDFLKTEAAFWKQQITDAGAEWIEPRADDHTARARWGER